MAVLNFQLDPLLSFLEGCGYVARGGASPVHAVGDRKSAGLARSGEPPWPFRTIDDVVRNGNLLLCVAVWET